MNRWFKKLFIYNTAHSYFKNGYCNDLVFTPDEGTQQMLANHGLHLKNTPYGFFIYYESADADKSPLHFLDIYPPFTFYLHITNKDFLTYTQLLLKEVQQDVYYFKQGGNDDLINQSLIELRPPIFSFAFETEQLVDKLTVVNSSNHTVLEIEFSPTTKSELSITLSEQPAGEFAFKLKSNNNIIQEKVIYIDGKAVTEGIFGILTMPFIGASNYEELKEYNIKFLAKNKKWLYYFKLQSKSYEEHIFDVLYDGEFSFKEVDQNIQYLQGETVIFESEQKIPYREEPYAGIKLKAEYNGNDFDLINNLPNPTPRFISPEMFIQV